MVRLRENRSAERMVRLRENDGGRLSRAAAPRDGGEGQRLRTGPSGEGGALARGSGYRQGPGPCAIAAGSSSWEQAVHRRTSIWHY